MLILHYLGLILFGTLVRLQFIVDLGQICIESSLWKSWSCLSRFGTKLKLNHHIPWLNHFKQTPNNPIIEQNDNSCAQLYLFNILLIQYHTDRLGWIWLSFTVLYIYISYAFQLVQYPSVFLFCSLPYLCTSCLSLICQSRCQLQHSLVGASP